MPINTRNKHYTEFILVHYVNTASKSHVILSIYAYQVPRLAQISVAKDAEGLEHCFSNYSPGVLSRRVRRVTSKIFTTIDKKAPERGLRKSNY